MTAEQLLALVAHIARLEQTIQALEHQITELQKAAAGSGAAPQ